jgi:hypothetical protein
MPTLIFNTEMKKLLIALFAVAGGCRNQDEPHVSAAQPISSPDSAAGGI